MRSDGRRHHLLLLVIFFLAVFLCPGSGPVPARAGDEVVENGNPSASAAVTSEPDGSTDEAVDDDFGTFDDFEEFDTGSKKDVFDPLIGYNRVMTRVNDRLYYWVIKPVARGYKFVMPEPARKGIGNFFRNLGFPVRMVNNLLQLKFKRAGTETARFVVNTTVGVAGFWDAADGLLGWPVYPEDFGQTLGFYGLGGGFPVVLPVFGPSNVRDIFGRAGDWFLDPVNYIDNTKARTGVNTVRGVNEASLRLGQYEAITKDALDLYIFLRDGYQDMRNKAIEE